MSATTFARRLPALTLLAGLSACSGQAATGTGFAPSLPPSQETGSVSTRIPAREDAAPNISSPRIFTANRDGSQLLGFAMSASGNVAPSVNISGSKTTLTSPDALAVDKLGNLYVANDGDQHIVVFAKTANGNVAPKRILGGPRSQLGPTEGIYADPYGSIWASDYANQAVTAYPVHSQGDVLPTVVLAGSKTQLKTPVGIAMNASRQLYVANANGPSITIYASGANGNVAPSATIAGSLTGLSHPFALAFDKTGRLLVADEVSGLLVFAAGATGNVAPVAIVTSVSYAAGVMADGHNHIWVAEFMGNSIDEYASNANGNATPIKRITGPNTLLNGANYLVKD